MSVVLREHEWAENMIQSKTLGKKPSETLYRVARYYIDKGYSKKEARKLLDIFLIQCEPASSLPKWADALDYALSRALKYEAIEIDSITITKPELDKINELDGKQIKRLAFTLLCLAKYWQIIIPCGNNWVNNKDSEIMTLANINTSIKRQALMYHKLRECGMIQFSKKIDNTNVRVCFIEDGEAAFKVTDFKNLGNQYMLMTGSPDYIICQNCGAVVRKNTVKPKCYKQSSGVQKYCKSCAYEVALKQTVNSVMRFRGDSYEKKYTVYMHIFPNGKRYIGTTSVTPHERWNNGHGYRGMEIDSAIKEFGWENVQHYLLFESCDKNSARLVEDCMIEKYKTNNPNYGYNTHRKNCCENHSEIIPDFVETRVDGRGILIAN